MTTSDGYGPEERAKYWEMADQIIARAEGSKLKATLQGMGGSTVDRNGVPFIKLSLPNGRDATEFFCSLWDFPGILAADFEAFSILGEYSAIWNTRTGEIEVGVGSGSWASSRGAALNRRLSRLPGVETLSHQGDPIQMDSIPDENLEMDEFEHPLSWRLRVRDGETQLQLSQPSDCFVALFGGGLSMVISGTKAETGEEALAQVVELGNALLFDIDLAYGIPLQFTKQRSRPHRGRRVRSDRALEFPKNRYPQQALQFYQYGRAASGLPLLEYLAYYQSIECFFPTFARKEVVSSLRIKLLHPSFDPHDDQALAHLIEVASADGRGSVSEKEQLRATVRGCLDKETLKRHIQSPENGEHFVAKKQRIGGVDRIGLDQSAVDIRDQVADRIYAIRCRIVHSKQGAAGSFEEALLPTGPEASALGPDLDLIRVIASAVVLSQAAKV